LNNFKNLYALEACARDNCVNSDGKLPMDKFLDNVFFDDTIGVCVITATHFCSFCLATSDANLPDEFCASCYSYHCGLYPKVEICICHVNKECIEVCKKVISSD